MSGTQQKSNNQIYAFGCGTNADVLPPATYAQEAFLQSGFQVGIADPQEINTVMRQSSFVAAAFAQWVADTSGQTVLDSGNIAQFEAQIQLGVTNAAVLGANILWQGFQAGPNTGLTITMPSYAGHVLFGGVGGGGGGASPTGIYAPSGGGGGAGGWIEAIFPYAPGTTFTAIIGAGGGPSQQGGSTVVYQGGNSILVAVGGSGAYFASSNLSSGGAGGAVNVASNGRFFNYCTGSTGGDGCLDAYTTGFGNGGVGPFGGQGRAGSPNGISGVGFGSGGGGGYTSNSSSSARAGTGGSGAPGLLRWAFIT